MASDMASMQFATAAQVQVGADTSYHIKDHQTGEPNPSYQGAPDVAPYMTKTSNSADRATAWRLKRGIAEPPQPYSKRTSGSLYNFD